MDNNDKKISDYIDSLNAEEEPRVYPISTDSAELEKILDTVRKVRSLKETTIPEDDYHKKLAYNLSNQLKRKNRLKTKRVWIASMTSLAAVLIIALLLNFSLSSDNTNIVYAIEQAYQEVKAYHGTIEIVETNGAGEKNLQGKLEIWADQEGHYYMKVLEGSNKDLITVNNGEKKFQIRPDQNQVHVFAAFPDAYRFILELGEEVEEVKSALSTKVVGEDIIAGRKTTILEVTPDGGLPYKVWIDNETKLPLQKQNAMQNAIQYTMTYTEIKFEKKIPEAIIAYQFPESFTVIYNNAEQLVNSLEEAREAIGYSVILPENLPDKYFLDSISIVPDQKLVKFYYSMNANDSRIVVIQGKSAKDFKMAGTALLGKVGNYTAEIQSPIYEDLGVLGGGGLYAGVTNLHSIRWQEIDFEYAVVGDVSLKELITFTESLTKVEFEMTLDESESLNKPEVEVPVDLEIEKNEQKGVDAGSSPWKLDPVFVAQVFVSMQISPEGITGDYPVKYEDFKVSLNNGTEAVVELNPDNAADIQKVYLKKLVRQDATGIWTVVGYDKN